MPPHECHWETYQKGNTSALGIPNWAITESSPHMEREVGRTVYGDPRCPNINPLLRCVAPYHNPILRPVLSPRLLMAAGGALRRRLLGLGLAFVRGFASLEGTNCVMA